jgi:hypothetical protein
VRNLKFYKNNGKRNIESGRTRLGGNESGGNDGNGGGHTYKTDNPNSYYHGIACPKAAPSLEWCTALGVIFW